MERTPTPGDASWRLFIAAAMPEEVKDVLAATARSVPEQPGAAVRWSRPEMIHLTLRFLGDTEPSRVDAIVERMGEAATRSASLTLRLDDTGAFPDLRRPRVLWVGLAGETERLRQLHARLEGSLAQIGIEQEKRRYDPHLTVGRIRSGVRPLHASQAGQAFAHARLPEPRPEFLVDAIVLFRSFLSESGPRYEQLASVPLG